jgi:hypothetical protein
MVHSFREPRAKTSPRDGTQVSAQEPRWSRGPIAQQLAARFALRRLLVAPATAIAGARGAQPAKVWQLRGVGRLPKKECLRRVAAQAHAERD